MTQYYVKVNAEFCEGYTVEAESEEEAQDIAKENFEYDHSSDWNSIELSAEEL